ncbi:MAG TPA: pitrilysin family protein [Candidatus Hydrogenedentes bacterium]|nr:pitrilysin family protein [Candidatus Hydrogenedentota bacterium]
MAQSSNIDGISIHILPNGMTVTLERLPYLHSATAGVWVQSGSANEQPHEAGVAHFLEHLFFKGTKNRNVRQIMEAIEGRGGHLNAFTSREHTCLHVRMLSRHIHTGIEILGDLVNNSLFNDVEKERNVILEEIATIEDTPDDYVHDLLTEYHWPNHPLGRPIFGGVESVSGLTRDHMQTFYNTWYAPENLYFSVAGNFDEGAVLEQISGLFENIPARQIPALDAGPSFHAGVNILPRDIGQAHVCLGFPGPTLCDQERYICDLLSSVLGGGSTSRLFERIREDEGLAYAIYTFHAFHQSTGMLGVYAAVAPQNFKKVMGLVFEELRRIREESLSEEELDMNREQIKGNLLMAMENTSTRMSRMAKSMMYYGRILTVEEIIRHVDEVTCEDIQRIAQNTFTPEKCAVVVLGPTNGCKLDRVPL